MGPDLDCVDSTPVHTAPAEHAPAEPSPFQPASLDPAPVHPDPVDPAPVHPDPVDTASVHPDPVDPAPVHPDPVDTASVHPDPVDPAPVHPDPVDPASVHPDPVDTASVHPDPVDTASVHPDPVDPASVHPDPVDTASVHPDPVYTASVRPARSCLAPVYRKRAGSARRKRVAFDEKVKVQYHDRCPSFDRFPSDRLNLPLGMYPAKSDCGTEPLSEEKDTRYKLPRLSYQQRFELLGPVWDTEDAQTQREWSEDSENLETIEMESMQSGCDCFGGFCDKYCECIQAGIKCCVSVNPMIKDSVCACSPYGCSNQDESGCNPKQQVKNHRNATFARLAKEREEEMGWHQRDIEQATRKDDVQEQLTGSDAQSRNQSDSKVLAQVGDQSGREVSASVVDQSVSDTSALVGDLIDSNLLALVGDPSGSGESALLGNLFGTELLASVEGPSDGDVSASVGDSSDGQVLVPVGESSEMLDQDDNVASGLVDMYEDPCDSELPAPHGRKRLWSQTD